MSRTRRSASHGEAGYPIRKAGDYFTEPWVTDVLCKYLVLTDMTIFEPACGDGRMSDRLSIFGNRIISNDLYNYGYPHQDYQFDFLKDKHPTNDYDAIITNPPYDLIIEFISLAVGLTRAKKGMVCMLARHEFDATHSAMFDYPYCMKLILPRRPTWIDGKDIAAPRFPFAWYIYDWKSNYFDKPKTVWLDDSGRSIHARGLLA